MTHYTQKMDITKKHVLYILITTNCTNTQIYIYIYIYIYVYICILYIYIYMNKSYINNAKLIDNNTAIYRDI